MRRGGAGNWRIREFGGFSSLEQLQVA